MRERYFFVHVMKTGGTTFWWQAYLNFGAERIYPENPVDAESAYFSVPLLREVPDERHAGLAAYTGHFPAVAVELVPAPVRTMTILREPVERTLSYLRQAVAPDGPMAGASLEEVYEAPSHFEPLIHNHQVKQFAMTLDDPLESYRDVIEIDDRRLALAKDRLDATDVIGLHEEYESFLRTVESNLGWRTFDVGPQRVSEIHPPVSATLRRRIEADNAADLDFYEHARSVVLR